MSKRFTLHHGDCVEVMRSMPDNSVDSIVTDPPYGLEFMGKEWDSFTGKAATSQKLSPAMEASTNFRMRGKKLQQDWGQHNFQLWCEQWAKEALRVLKPGGHLLAFSGSRTYHRMAVAIEDAGFEIRDQIMWIYGSGFPKSLDVSKAIDKAAGAEREVVGQGKGRTGQAAQPNGSSFSDDNYQWPGDFVITAPATPAAQQWQGWGTALKPAHEPIVVARKPLTGTVAANVLAHGVGALNIDGCRVGTEQMGGYEVKSSLGRRTNEGGEHKDFEATTTQGRWPANVIHDGSDEVVALFPDTKGATSNSTGSVSFFGNGGESSPIMKGRGDSGSAARFFYCAKANKRDRNEGLDGFEERPRPTMGDGISAQPNQQIANNKNHHPTVKPCDLMRYLIRLVSPPGATVLDPFMGSGSTGKAAMYEGVNFIGIEQDAEYLAIAKARIEFALNKPLEVQLFERKDPTDEQLLDQLALPLDKEETA